jgi:2-methylcitrate dehydratase PrpD
MTTSMPGLRATDAVIDYAVGYRLADEDPAVVAMAKTLLLDCLGVAYAAARGGGVGRLASLVARPGPGMTLIGLPEVAAAADAAFVNGYAAHLAEFDDSTLRPVGHPSATILPALLALAEDAGSGGGEFLAAYLVALEVHARLGLAQPAHWTAADTWLPIGTIGLLAATVGAVRLAGLDRAAAGAAVGIAAHLSGQLSLAGGSSAKPLGAGHSARTAVQAVQFAECGLTGPARAIEAPGGFAAVFLRVPPADQAALAAALDRLGVPAYLGEAGIALKRYPSCYGAHWSVDALREIVAASGLRGPEVAAVDLVYPQASGFLDDPAPTTVEAARFSFQYNLASCLVDGYPRLESFTEAALAEPSRREALARVRARPHGPGVPAPECWEHRVTVTTRDGRELSGSVRHPHGHPRDPLTGAEAEEKFLANTAPMGRAGARAAVGLVRSIETLPNVAELARAFRAEDD